MARTTVSIDQYKTLAVQYQTLRAELEGQRDELKQRLEQQGAQFKYWLDHPELIALAHGDMYLKKDAAEEFAAPLARLLFCPLEDVEPRQVPAPDAAAASSPAVPGLREIVAACVTILAEMRAGPLDARPPIPGELQPPPIHAPHNPGAIGQGWAPPARPGPLGPNSATRRALFDLLSRS